MIRRVTYLAALRRPAMHRDSFVFDYWYRAFSLTCPATMLIHWNKRNHLHEKSVQLSEDFVGTSTWPPFHCFGTPMWPPWCHVKTLYDFLFTFGAACNNNNNTNNNNDFNKNDNDKGLCLTWLWHLKNL